MVALATAFIRLRADPDRVSAAKAGKVMGDAAGDAAGKGMGAGITRGIDGKLRDERGRFVKDGETIGAGIGAGIGRGIGKGTKKASADTSAFGNALAITAARATLFGSTAAAALPSVIHLTAALAPAAGAVNILPAGLLAGAAAMGTFKLATVGVSKAISTGLTGTAAQAKKAMDGLPPAAQRFAKSIIDLKPRIDALKASVSQRFFLPLQNEIKPLAELYFPMLRREMSNLAGPLGGLGEQIAQSARSAGVFSAVTTIFRTTRISVINLRGAIDPLTQALANMIHATAGFLPGLAQGFTNLATRVASFVTAAAKSGQIAAAFRAAMTTLRDLGGIAVNVGSILGSVFTAASKGSGSLLANLRNLTGQVAAFLRSAEGSGALTSVFSTLATLGNALRTSLAAVLPAVARSLQIIGPVLAGLAGPAAQLVVALAPLLPYFTSLAAIVLRALTPAIASLAGWMTQHATAVRVLGTAVAGLLIGMKLYTLYAKIAGPVTLAWGIATGTAGVAAEGASIGVRLLGLAIRFMMGPVGLIITAIGLLAAGLVYLFNHNKTFHDAVIASWNGIKTAVGAVASWLTGTIMPSIRTAIDQGAAVWNGLRNVVAIAWNGIKTVIGAVVNVVKGYIAVWVAIFRGIGTVVTWLYSTIFAPYFRLIGGVVKTAWVVIQIAVAAIRAMFNLLGQAAVALYQRFIAPQFRLIAAVVRALYTATVQPVVNLIRAAWSAMATAIRAVWTSTIQPTFRAVASVATAIGNTLRTVFASIRSFFATLGNGIRAVWTGVISPTFNALITAVRDRVVGGFRTAVAGITNAWNRVRDAARVPVAFVVNHVINPLIGGINAAAKFFGVKDRAPTIPGFAHGGRIPGRASATDNLLATMTDARGKALSPMKVATGEYVVNSQSTSKWLPWLEAINGSKNSAPRGIDPMRDGLAGFADGGLVGWAKGLIGKGAKAVSNVFKAITDPSGTIKKLANSAINAIPGGGGIRNLLVGAGHKVLNQAIGWLTSLGGLGGAGGIAGNASPGFPPWPSSPGAQRGDSGVWRKVVALIKSTGPISGSFGNGYRAGDPLWHGSGRAVDWMGYNQNALATFLSRRNPLELIHRTNLRDYAYTRGRNKGSFNNSLMQAHRNHVHIAMAEGGLLGGGIIDRIANSGPVKLMDRGGTLSPGFNSVYNGTGKDERLVRTDEPVPVVEFHAHFHGPVASERAAEDMVYGAWKRLKKQRKIA
jgi:phage-related protein